MEKTICTTSPLYGLGGKTFLEPKKINLTSLGKFSKSSDRVKAEYIQSCLFDDTLFSRKLLTYGRNDKAIFKNVKEKIEEVEEEKQNKSAAKAICRIA